MIDYLADLIVLMMVTMIMMTIMVMAFDYCYMHYFGSDLENMVIHVEYHHQTSQYDHEVV